MKIVKIKGGLGNQLFQYAYGRSLELAGKKIVFDTSFFAGNKAGMDTPRNFTLDKFDLKTKAEFSNKKHSVLDFVDKVLVKANLVPNGFWQSEKYFKNIEANIRQEFMPKLPLDNKFANILNQIEHTPSVSIHIRRGDYVNNEKTKSVHNVCGLSYYQKAIDIILASVNNPTFFIFSDDIDWVSKNLVVPHPTFWVSNLKGEDYEELILMSKCKHNIIANSSFSWWGAWLNTNPDKIVIAPKQWLTNKTSNGLNILPSLWTQI